MGSRVLQAIKPLPRQEKLTRAMKAYGAKPEPLPTPRQADGLLLEWRQAVRAGNRVIAANLMTELQELATRPKMSEELHQRVWK